MTIETPYFMTDDSWYYWNNAKKRWELTDKATKEARESYRGFYKTIERVYGKGGGKK